MTNKMMPMDAWHIISSNLMELYKLKRTDNYKGYSIADVQAEVICFIALNFCNNHPELLKALKEREDK